MSVKLSLLIEMTEEKDLTRMIPITLFMIFVSGCWTLASIIPFSIRWPAHSAQLAIVTVADVAFLIALLALMLSYGGMAEKEAVRRWAILMFCVGMVTLIASIILFSSSYLLWPPYSID